MLKLKLKINSNMSLTTLIKEKNNEVISETSFLSVIKICKYVANKTTIVIKPFVKRSTLQ